jgi:Spy/CpxP family protein refolding chaperone
LNKTFVSLCLCGFLLLCNPVWAQEQKNPDPLGDNLFPPELLMQHQNALGLTEDQKNFIKTEMRKASLQFTELSWQLQDEMEIMTSLVKQNRVDEQQVLAELDKLLALEREIKRLQFSLIVKIKNRLTPEQQHQLMVIKNKIREN